MVSRGGGVSLPDNAGDRVCIDAATQQLVDLCDASVSALRQPHELGRIEAILPVVPGAR